MTLTAIDISVLLFVGGAALLGLKRGFVYEVLALFAWMAVVFAIKVGHLPLSRALTPVIGTASGAAVLSLALLGGVTYFGGRMVANAVGSRTRRSVLGPVDRALGFGFGALKGLILASLAFLLLVLVLDVVRGGPQRRPEWLKNSRTYPLLNSTSRSVSDFLDRRRKGQSVWGAGNEAAPADNAS